MEQQKIRKNKVKEKLEIKTQTITEMLEMKVAKSDIAKTINVSTVSLYRFLQKHPEIECTANQNFYKQNYKFYKKILNIAFDDNHIAQAKALSIYNSMFNISQNQQINNSIKLKELELKKIDVENKKGQTSNDDIKNLLKNVSLEVNNIK
jgi:CRISPR/Cas system CSM-associated protein Csm2 small subunit